MHQLADLWLQAVCTGSSVDRISPKALRKLLLGRALQVGQLFDHGSGFRRTLFRVLRIDAPKLHDAIVGPNTVIHSEHVHSDDSRLESADDVLCKIDFQRNHRNCDLLRLWWECLPNGMLNRPIEPLVEPSQSTKVSVQAEQSEQLNSLDLFHWVRHHVQVMVDLSSPCMHHLPFERADEISVCGKSPLSLSPLCLCSSIHHPLTPVVV